MAKCPRCGETTSADHSFCLNCGAELPANASSSGSSDAPSSRPSAAASAASGSSATSSSPTASGLSASAPSSPEPKGSAQSGPTGARLRQRGLQKRRRRSGREAAIPALVALVASLVLQQLINSVVPADAYLHRLFRPAGGWIMSVVPALIAFVFVWTITDLILKLRVARTNEADLERTDVNQVALLVRQEPTNAVLQRIRAWDVAMLTRPVGRRIMWLLQHLDTVDAQRAHELTRHQSDLESDTAASGYRTVRLFIWAMPILGFIGTVLGISLAVGGFSDFLTTNVSIDEIDRVTAELGNVASGLSFAFDTTLLGLLAGLVASVASSAVQSKEERFLTGLEELGLRIMENATPRDGSAAGAGTPVGEEFDQMMRGRLQELEGQMRQFTRAVQSGLDGFLTEWGKLPPEVEKVTSDLAGLREHLSSAAKSTDQLLLETRLLLEGLNEASTSMGNRLQSSIGSINQTVEGLGSSLGGISETLEASLSGLGDHVRASESHLREGLTSLQETLSANQSDEGAIRDALERLSTTISELRGTLGDFRETQSAMMPLLSQLSGPLELRLMPTPIASPQRR